MAACLSDIIADFCGITPSPAGLRALHSATHGTRASAKKGRLHDIKRDSSGLATAWHKEAGSEVMLRIRDSVGESTRLFCSDWQET
jgi:hypothetical protein